MGSLNFKCPPGAALTAPAKVTCPEKFGQIQLLALRIKEAAGDVAPTFATVADLIDQAKWVAALALTTAKKIVITPFMSGVVIPPGTAIKEEGGNNNTVNGISILSGISQVAVTGRFINLPESIAETLRTYSQYSALTPGFSNLEAFPINEFGDILYRLAPDGVKPIGFDLFNWFVGTPGSEGLNKPNITPLEWEFDGQWSKGLGVAHPLSAVAPWDPRTL